MTNILTHMHITKAHFKNSQANNRKKPQELDRRKEKERKREEKGLRKMAVASGIKIPNAQPFALTHIALTDSRNDVSADATPSDDGPIATNTPPNVPPRLNVSGGFKKSGWAIVGATGDLNSSILFLRLP